MPTKVKIVGDMDETPDPKNEETPEPRTAAAANAPKPAPAAGALKPATPAKGPALPPEDTEGMIPGASATKGDGKHAEVSAPAEAAEAAPTPDFEMLTNCLEFAKGQKVTREQVGRYEADWLKRKIIKPV